MHIHIYIYIFFFAVRLTAPQVPPPRDAHYVRCGTARPARPLSAWAVRQALHALMEHVHRCTQARMCDSTPTLSPFSTPRWQENGRAEVGGTRQEAKETMRKRRHCGVKARGHTDEHGQGGQSGAGGRRGGGWKRRARRSVPCVLWCVSFLFVLHPRAPSRGRGAGP